MEGVFHNDSTIKIELLKEVIKENFKRFDLNKIYFVDGTGVKSATFIMTNLDAIFSANKIIFSDASEMLDKKDYLETVRQQIRFLFLRTYYKAIVC